MKRIAASLLALAASAAFARPATAPRDIAYESVPDFLQVPADKPLGEVAGVATNAAGHVFVFTRTDSETMTAGGSRAFVHGGSKLYEYDRSGHFVREIGKDIYGFLAAHVVRVDAQDNIWVVDEGSNMVIKFAPDGRVLMTLGRKPEAVFVPAKPAPAGDGLGIPGDTFDGPADVAWDKAGNIFVADGSGNARIVKFTPDGAYVTAWGGRGSGEGQMSQLHSLAVDAAGNVYVADRGNKRIQVFDNDGKFLRDIRGIGTPAAICITPGPHPWLYSSNSNGPTDFDNGEIYRMELDGRILGRFGKPGRGLGEFSSVHEIDCRAPDSIVVGELGTWRAQKLVFKAR